MIIMSIWIAKNKVNRKVFRLTSKLFMKKEKKKQRTRTRRGKTNEWNRMPINLPVP